ncbi:MAG: glycosyltransferase family 2 protein [Congregibacter sp.]
MKLDIIFSTFNGALRLRKMLEAFCALDIPEMVQLSVIGIDNAPTDSSGKVLRSYEQRLPLKILQQPKPGKNAALNLAIAHSRGEIVVFTDDNIIPNVDWIVRLTEAFHKNPDFDLFGGAVVPRWPSKPPPRLLDQVPLGAAFAITPDTLKTGPCDASEIWGNNMAVRKYIFSAGHRFNEDMGASAADHGMGSGTEFLKRCQTAGHKAFFEERAVVQHMIRKEQLTARWLEGRGHRFGQSYFYSELHEATAKPTVTELRGAPRWAMRKKIGYQIKAALPFIRNYSTVWKSGFYAGYVREYRNWHRDKASDETAQWQRYTK